MFWYEDEVKSLENKIVSDRKDRLKVLLYGSSSIRLWESAQNDFEEFDIVNQAFGGSTLAACCWYFPRLVPEHKPDAIVLYAGDNDLGDGRHPEEVFFLFKNMMELIKNAFGEEIPVAFISIKPSPSRQNLYDSISYTNKIIKSEIKRNYPNATWVEVFDSMQNKGWARTELYSEDGLHMNSKGYAIWKERLAHSFLKPLQDSKNTKKRVVKKRA